jgi:nucleoside phosphorylase
MAYLVCFAVRQEARHFRPPDGWGGRIVVTGMGEDNAARAARAALDGQRFEGALTCGFAGGLAPELRQNEIVWDADNDLAIVQALSLRPARRGIFHFSHRVAITAREKEKLRMDTGADAVEMESRAIREICRGRGVPSATIRVISDTAAENLPLDFNSLVNHRHEMNYLRLALALLKKPAAIPELARFGRRIDDSGRALGAFLGDLLQSRH